MLQVYDAEKAWRAFQRAFEWLAPLVVVNEITNTVRLACHPDELEAQGPQGIMIDLELSEALA